MSNYSQGTVLRVESTGGLRPDIEGLSFHLDGDNVWRETTGQGVEFPESMRQSYAASISVAVVSSPIVDVDKLFEGDAPVVDAAVVLDRLHAGSAELHQAFHALLDNVNGEISKFVRIYGELAARAEQDLRNL